MSEVKFKGRAGARLQVRVTLEDEYMLDEYLALVLGLGS